MPPLRPVPSAPTELAVSRVGDRVTLRLTVPETNADPASPLSISGIQIYARTLPMGSEPPTADQLMRNEFLVATIPVRGLAPVDESGDPVPSNPTAPPDARPGPGEVVVWRETVPTAAARPLELTRAQKAKVDARRMVWLPVRPTGLLAPWFRFPLPTRYYAAVGVSERRRPGTPSPFAAVQFGPAPDKPSDLKVTHSESELIVTWTTAVARAPVTLVETTRDGVEKAAPVQDVPITTGSWKAPVVFGVERCFVVRGILRSGSVSTESASTEPRCDTPKDTYGPPAPTQLNFVSDPDAVTLVWNAVTAPDLAGYIVLRATGASETLQELTPKPITQLQFADSTARAGQRYVYYVVAVDAAGNRSPRSNSVDVNRFTLAGK